MEVTELTLDQWKERLDDFYRENGKTEPRAAFRIDNTIFSTARHYGGFVLNGAKHTVFYFPDGAMIGVRQDFLKWLKRQLKEDTKRKAKKAEGYAVTKNGRRIELDGSSSTDDRGFYFCDGCLHARWTSDGEVTCVSSEDCSVDHIKGR